MSDGDGNTQNPQGDEPYKTFSTETDFKDFQSKSFSNGYNNYRDSAVNKFSEILGEDVTDFQSGIERVKDLKQKLAEQVTDPTSTQEYTQLNDNFKQLKKELEDSKTQVTQIQNQYRFDSAFNTALNKTLHNDQGEKISELPMESDDLKHLFGRHYTPEFAERDIRFNEQGRPVMDENNNYKSMESLVSDFAKRYMKPVGQGTGGASGDTQTGKPLYSEFQKANQENNTERAVELVGQAQANGGWSEPNAPDVF